MTEFEGYQSRDFHRSVWNQGRHRHAPKRYGAKDFKSPSKNDAIIASKLVAITAAGPIYSYQSHIVALPLEAALALAQELAVRSIDPKANVVSSLANRVRGESARTTWLQVCAAISSQLMSESPRYRLSFLSGALAYIYREDNINGIEPILGAAINAAWPWINDGILERVLAITSKYLATSEFAKVVTIPIADPINRTFSIFQPGELAKVDLKRWLDWRMLTNSAAAVTRAGGRGGVANGDIFGADGLLGPGVPGHKGVDLGGLQGADGNGPRSIGSGGDSIYGPGGLLGPGMPGHQGADLGGLLGADGNGPSRAGSDGTGIYGTGGVLGPGTPGHRGVDLSGLQGIDGRGPSGGSGGDGVYGAGGLLGAGMPGHRGLDLTNLGGSGGPLGFGSALGRGGVEDPDQDALDGMKSTGDTAKTYGGMLLAVGMATGLAPVAVTGAVFIWAGDKISTNARDWAQNPGGSQPAKADQPPSKDVHDLPDAPTDVHKLPDAKPKQGDVYPSPDGKGGGSPTKLPDFEGGGGNPTTIWDEHGGGGNPTTIWDEHGGGGNPTTIWDENGGGGGIQQRPPNFSRLP